MHTGSSTLLLLLSAEDTELISSITPLKSWPISLSFCDTRSADL